MKISKTKIFISLLVVGAIGLGAWKYFSPTKAAVIDFKDIVAVSTGSIESHIDLVSKINLLDKETLTFRQTGKIASLNVTEGQKIKAGTIMASLDTATLDRDIASQKISLDNARISLQKLYEASDATALLKSSNTLETSKRALETARLDLASLGREKDQALRDQKINIDESQKSVDTLSKKLDSMKLDLAYTKETETNTINQTKAEGDSRLKTTKNNAVSLVKDERDAAVTYEKILLVDDPNNPILLQLGSSEYRNQANFAYLGVKEAAQKLEDASDLFDPTTATIDQANTLASSSEELTKKLVTFNSIMKELIESSVIGWPLTSSMLDSYRSSISSFNSKFSGWTSSIDNNIKDLATGTSVSTIELSTQSSVSSKEASLASSELDLIKLQNSIVKLQNDLTKMGLDYDAKIVAKQLEISADQDAIKVNQATYDQLAAGPKSTDIQQAQNSIKSIELSIAKSEATRKDYQLVAPVDGVVSAIAIRKGQQSTTTDWFNSTSGITVENRDIIQLAALVDQTQAVKIQVGMPVKVTFDAYRNKTFDAKVSFLESLPIETSGVVSYTVKFLMQKPQEINLYDDMTASARIIVDRTDNVIVVPLSAIQDGKNGKFVQVYTNGALKTQNVTVGKSDADRIEVVSGLTAGQRIVIRPYAATAANASSGFNLGSLFGGGRGGAGGGAWGTGWAGRSFGGGAAGAGAGGGGAAGR